MRALLAFIAQTTDDGVFLPEDGGSALVWVIFIGLIVALYLVVSRTRRRAEQEFWERKRKEREDQ
ncbi:MAG: hypothetical protein V3V29_10675 [Acidimicrobiia bacterium]